MNLPPEFDSAEEVNIWYSDVEPQRRLYSVHAIFKVGPKTKVTLFSSDRYLMKAILQVARLVQEARAEMGE